MADLIIKPSSGNSLVFQDEGGDPALTVGTTGNTTLAGTANNLGTATAGTLSSGVTFPAGHIIRFYSHTDVNYGSYSSDTNPLGGSSGLRSPASGTNITTTVANSKFYVSANVSSSWGGSHHATTLTVASDWGLFLYRNNVSGTTSTRLGGGSNHVNRGGDNSWFGTDDMVRLYNPLDSRSFAMAYLDAPNCAAGSTLYYSVGVSGQFQTDFPYNRTGQSSAYSASTLTVYEIAP